MMKWKISYPSKYSIIGLYFLVTLLNLSCNQNSGDYFSENDRSLLEKDVLASFQIDDAFQIELFAAEPLVKDPVAMEIDELGNIYVVEMPGYPLDLSGNGSIKLLKDTDGNGFPDKSITFADNLILPTGVMRWKEGIIVTDAPDVLYLADTTGDGRADIREVLLTGFARSNPQHNLNSPMYGLDNWIYLAHEYAITTRLFPKEFGDDGDEIVFPHQPDTPRLPINAAERSVRFKPEQYELETLSSQTQYGHTFSPWGHYFQTSNANHLYHEVIAAQYLQRKDQLLVADAMNYLPAYGPGVEVYARTQLPIHQLLTDVGTITSACGIHWYQGGAFPANYQDVIFTCEPTHNLIHADKLRPKGSSFVAERLFADKEFLASTDASFRPVQLYTGPQGEMYVIDYYRSIIEHPEWMSEEINSSGQLYEGSDKGRIYRIRTKSTSQPDPFYFSNYDLPLLLGSSNGWLRKNAQRLLVNQGGKDKVDRIVHLLDSSANPFLWVHGLWTLEGLGELNLGLVLRGLSHPHAGVRENAIKLAEIHRQAIPDLIDYLEKMGHDENSRVRFQLLCSLGYFTGKRSASLREKLLFDNLEDSWMQLAAMSALELDPAELLNKAKFGAYSKGRAELCKQLSAFISLGTSGELTILSRAAFSDTEPVWFRQAVLEGIAMVAGFSRNMPFVVENQTRLLSLIESPHKELRSVSLDLLGHTELKGDFRKIAERLRLKIADQSEADEKRADALKGLSLVDAGRALDQAQSLFTPQSSGYIKAAALDVMGKSQENHAIDFIISVWNTLSADLRKTAVTALLGSPATCHKLLEAVDRSKIDPEHISWPQKVMLMNNDDPEVLNHARKVFATYLEPSSEIVQKFKPSLNLPYTVSKGKNVFEVHCRACHTYMGKDGTALGPDLSTLRNRDPQAIMMDILLPNRSLADGFELWSIALRNGTTLEAFLLAENPATIKIKDLTGLESVLPRKEIMEMKAGKISAMPESFGSVLSLQDMSDLLAFIRGR